MIPSGPGAGGRRSAPQPLSTSDRDRATRGRLRRVPPPDRGGMHDYGGSWWRVQVDAKRRPTLPAAVIEAAGLPGSRELVVRADGPGRTVLEDPAVLLAEFQSAVARGKKQDNGDGSYVLADHTHWPASRKVSAPSAGDGTSSIAVSEDGVPPSCYGGIHDRGGSQWWVPCPGRREEASDAASGRDRGRWSGRLTRAGGPRGRPWSHRHGRPGRAARRVPVCGRARQGRSRVPRISRRRPRC